MATLDNRHKSFIVKELACYERPTEIIDRVQEEFGVEVTRQQVTYYNPESAQGSRQLADKWRRLFDETRTDFIEGTIETPIAQKSWRIEQLQKIHYKYMDMGNYQAAAAIIEQVAREMCDYYGSSAARIAEQASGGGQVNFYQQINNKIVQLNRK